MLTVEKIGGTSMTALADVLNNIVFYPAFEKNLYNRVFVVSAFSGVTDMLLENKKTGSPGVYQADYQKYSLPAYLINNCSMRPLRRRRKSFYRQMPKLLS